MFNRGYGGMGFDDLEKTLVGYGIAIGLAVIATIVLVILLYVMILPKSKNGKLNKFFQWVHDYFHMKKLYIESVLRFFFIFGTIFGLCIGFFFMFVGKPPIIGGLLIMLITFITNRLVFEFNMMLILLVKNTMEINNRLNNKGGDLSFADQSGFTEKFSQVATTAASAASAAASAAAASAANSAQNANVPTGSAPQAPASEGNAGNAQADGAVCPSCGKPVAPGTKFCMVCGTKIPQ